MPRRLNAEMTFDDLEDEVLFTQAALRADPAAQPLLPMTEGWLPRIDQVRPLARQARQAGANADAARIIANLYLDRNCVAFGDDLYLAVGKDRQSRRWLQFFSLPVSRFVNQALSRQVERVQGWLTGATDPVLEKHRASLERWVKAADAALVDTRAVAGVRGQAWQAREELAEDLTRERDGLHDALSQLGREQGLPRDWPDLFFRVESRREAPESTPAAS